MAKKKAKPNYKADLKIAQGRILVLEGEKTNLQRQTSNQQDLINGLVKVLYPFTFEKEPNRFLGGEASFTQCFLKDTEVKRAREVFDEYRSRQTHS